jgi:nucleotide-binding universal stress UspA family protein
VSPAETETAIERILVAVDGSASTASVLRTAAELASALGAELHALFVEDAELIRLAGYPFPLEVGSLSARVRPLDPEQVRRSLRAEAAGLRRQLEALARRYPMSWELRIARGLVASEVTAAASGADLVILGRIGRSMGRRATGSTVRAVINGTTTPTFILHLETRLDMPVLVLYTSSDTGRKALRLGRRVADTRGVPVRVLALAEDLQAAARLRAEAARLTGEDAEGCGALALPTPVRVVHRVAMAGDGPLVIPCEGPRLTGEALHEIVDQVRNPVFLVR